jgi:hypothetical protein
MRDVVFVGDVSHRTDSVGRDALASYAVARVSFAKAMHMATLSDLSWLSGFTDGKE